jgi:tetratricopeptide (TPR) repeat protein
MRVSALLSVLSITLASVAHAQCADGRPIETCRAVPVAPKRVDPALDDKTWIVVPFDVAGTGDIGWLRDVSVNLLYSNLSKWKDIRVIDDERVLDLIRGVPEARIPKLTLDAARAVARRAGAGNLVMGAVLQTGSKTQVTAKVYTVRDGQRVRTAQDSVTVPDSLPSAFGRLARGVLNVAPPPGSNVGSAGTANIQALQDYVAGVQALNRFDVTEARVRFERALKADSNFAMAHYKLVIAGGYESISDEKQATAHADAAAKLSASLPEREQKLINGLVAYRKKDYARSCELYGQLVRADSSDTEALMGAGQCYYRDDAVEPVGPDSAQWRFRASWNTALRVFRRVLVVDPTFHPAFVPITDMLTATSRRGCRWSEAYTPCAAAALPANPTIAPPNRRFTAVLRRAGDSLVTEPVRAGTPAATAQAQDAQRQNAKRENLAQARRVAQDWVDAGPAEARSRQALAHVMIGLGDLAGAELQFAQITAKLPPIETYELLIDRFEVAVKTGDGTAAAKFFQSLSALSDSLSRIQRADSVTRAARGQPATLFKSTAELVIDGFSMQLPFIAGVLGHVPVRLDPRLMAMATAGIDTRFGMRALLGAPVDSIEARETRFGAPSVAMQMMMRDMPGTLNDGQLTLAYGLRLPRKSWPQVDSTDIRLRSAFALSRGDTALLRRTARSLDSSAAAIALRGGLEDGRTIMVADAFVLLGDSLSALKSFRRMLDTTMFASRLAAPVSGSFFLQVGLVYPRAMLLRADLAATLGFKDEARKWYDRFAKLWSEADAEFQPLVARAARGAAGRH